VHAVIRAEHVLMAPEQKFLEHKKRENAGKHQDRRLLFAAQPFKGLGQEMNESIAKQPAHRQAHHKKDDTLQPVFADGDKRQPDQRQQTDDDNAGEAI
jgi:hypothetical protein